MLTQGLEAQQISPGAIGADCRFCDIAGGKERSYFDMAQPLGDGDIYLVPTVGMMLPNYFLAVTQETEDHSTSFAQLEPSQLGRIDSTLQKVEEELAPPFDSYFRLEHGSDNLGTCGSGGCIDHAHIHLVPANKQVGSYVQEQLPWQKLDTYEDITEFRGRPYIYLGRRAAIGEIDGVSQWEERHYIVPEPKLRGQWVRRQIADALGDTILRAYGERYYNDAIGDTDWAMTPGAANLIHTMTLRRMLPRGPTIRPTDPEFTPSDSFHRPLKDRQVWARSVDT